MSNAPATSIVSWKELRKDLQEELENIGDMGTRRGRPRKNVLGSEKLQLTVDIGQLVLQAIIDRATSEGRRLDMDMCELYQFPKFVRQRASSVLGAMAKFNPSAKGGNHIHSLWKAVGKLIIVGVNEKGHNIYIRAATSTGVEFKVFQDFLKGRMDKSNALGNRGYEILKRGADAVGDERTLEEAYREECSRFLRP